MINKIDTTCMRKKRNFIMIEKNRSHPSIKFYGGEGRKYPEVPRIKYLILLKYGNQVSKSGAEY